MSRTPRVWLVAAAAAFFVFAFSAPASAFPWMIRHDYTGCANCHADPSGGGLLTAYGHAQSELLLSTRWRARSEEEEPSRVSQALFGAVELPRSLLVGGWFRNAYIWNSVDGKLVDRRFLQMRADLAAQVTVDRFRANATLGFASTSSKPLSQRAWLTSNANGPNLVSREHWLGADLADNTVLVRAGRLNLPFGLRNIEHTSWVRSETRTDTNQGQQHGAAVAYTSAKLRAEGMLIVGNFQVRPDAYRERGVAGYAEIPLGARTAVGASTLVARAATDLDARRETVRQAHGLFGRGAPWRPLVVLAEADLLVVSTHDDTTHVGYTGFVQADLEVLQGVHLAITGEALRRAKSAADPGVGIWGTVTWFPFAHFETRFDVVRRSGLGSADTMTYLVQGQIYL